MQINRNMRIRHIILPILLVIVMLTSLTLVLNKRSNERKRYESELIASEDLIYESEYRGVSIPEKVRGKLRKSDVDELIDEYGENNLKIRGIGYAD